MVITMYICSQQRKVVIYIFGEMRTVLTDENGWCQDFENPNRDSNRTSRKDQKRDNNRL